MMLEYVVSYRLEYAKCRNKGCVKRSFASDIQMSPRTVHSVSDVTCLPWL